jgi:Holliday junction resolvase RusA-like endonuclease
MAGQGVGSRRRMNIDIVGLPAPQGSKSGYYNKTTGRVVMVEGKSKTGRAAVASWRDAVTDACRRQLEQFPASPMTGPLAVTMLFRFPPTKTDPYRFWHAVKPDLDKLVRSTFDALKLGGAIADDSMISKLTTVKRFINGREAAGCSINIESLAGQEAEIRESRKQRAAMARRSAAPQMEALPL